MDDNIIVNLFFERNELAISKTSDKYGNYCYYIAYSILSDNCESEECVNDTYLKAWNCIPPKRPKMLKTFLGKITRNLSLNKFYERTAEKRGGNDFLTEEGKAWGNEYLNLQKYNYYDTLAVEPLLNSDGSYSSAAWSSATVELENYRTETSRYFAVCVESDSVFADNKSVELKYTLGSEPEYATISTENRINRKWYALKSDEQASEYFTPKILCITDLSCAVYGENNGYSQSGTNDDGSFWSEVMISPEESWNLCSNLGKVSFVSNNSKTDITTSTSLCDLYADIDGCDMTILTAYIAYVDYVNDVIVHNEIDLENINEIEICGVSYSLEEIDSPVKE